MHAHTSLVETEGRDLSDRHVLPAYEWPNGIIHNLIETLNVSEIFARNHSNIVI